MLVEPACGAVLASVYRSLDSDGPRWDFDGHDYGFNGPADYKDDLDVDDNDMAIIIMMTKTSFNSQLLGPK